jgi:dUTP pyrophosphatase
MSALSVRFIRLPHGEALPAPAYATGGAAGLDLVAAVPESEALTILPGAWAAVPTGLILEIPAGYQGEVRPRSGLALQHGVTILNAPGTIDSDYRGEVRVLLVNLGREKFSVTRGMRVAQIVFMPVTRVSLTESSALDATARGDGGFGSTGLERKIVGER